MRRWLLILMVALLPLRGWVGDAMAMEMATGGAVQSSPGTEIAINSIANYQELAWTKATFDTETRSQKHSDCPGHSGAAPTGEGGSTDSTASTDDGSTCTSCQVCHTVALAAVVSAAPARAVHFDAPRSSNTRFASALPARGFKPPIS